MSKKVPVKVKGKTVLLNTCKALFSRMAIIAEKRCVGFVCVGKLPKEIFFFPLGPIPWSLADTFGNLQKTNKATLLHHLERGVTPEENLPMNSAAVFDAMAIVQRHKPTGTFGDLATDILRSVVRMHRQIVLM